MCLFALFLFLEKTRCVRIGFIINIMQKRDSRYEANWLERICYKAGVVGFPAGTIVADAVQTNFFFSCFH